MTKNQILHVEKIVRQAASNFGVNWR